MNQKRIKVTWPNGNASFYESIVACSRALGITTTTIHSYLRGGAPMKCKFEYTDMTGEEELLRKVMNIDPVVRAEDIEGD